MLGIIEPPVTIKSIECAIIDRGFDEGWVVPSRPRPAPARKSPWSAQGPPGWPRPPSSTAPGHRVTVFERADRIGGLLMYGIPNMKLEKMDRRAPRAG